MPSSTSSPICRLECPSGKPQAFAPIVLMPVALSAVWLSGVPVAVKAAVAIAVLIYGLHAAGTLWRRPAATVIRDASGAYWLERTHGRKRLEHVRWEDFGYLVRLQARMPDSGRRVSIVWWTSAMPATRRRALRQAMNANRTPRAGALPATVANPLL